MRPKGLKDNPPGTYQLQGFNEYYGSEGGQTKTRASPSSTQASKERHNSGSHSPKGLCPEHFRPLEIYCLEPCCMTIVCANCALFGNHRGHKIREQEALENDTKNMLADLSSVSRQLAVVQQRTSKKEAVNKWCKLMADRIKAKESEINRFFEVKVK